VIPSGSFVFLNILTRMLQLTCNDVAVKGRLTIPATDGDLLHYSVVASAQLESASKAPATEVASSSCLRRAAALAGLGFELWE
jgi:hypothetical protein